MTNNALEVQDLKKSYGDHHVLRGINLAVPKGTMVALLGPNGAGKTTTVKIMSTLAGFDGGTVTVGGYDVARDADKVRTVIGLTGQSAAVDELLTGRENLVMMGRLYRLTAASAKARAEELLHDFDLVEAANRPVKTYSGGMRRRLDLAVSLIASPPIIFLDEPTTGLMAGGTTILLTTQYLEEADQLADRIVVIDGGVVIAEGTAKELKAKIGQDRLEIFVRNAEDLRRGQKTFQQEKVDVDEKTLSLSMAITDINEDVRRVLDLLARDKVQIESMAVHKPTLDDVFLSLTGHQALADQEFAS
jgi:ABC-2 type transport system ATP-binding protein